MKLNDLDFRKLAVFSQIVESGSYPRACEVLHVTPSALSQSVAALEFSLGLKLFLRRGNRLVPTEIGMNIHREFRLCQTSLLQNLEKIAAVKIDVSGTLRIGAYLEFAKSRLSEVIAAFVAEFPAANIKFVFDSPSRLQTLLAQGHVDLCFSIFPAKANKSIASTAIAQEELVLIAPNGRLPQRPKAEEILAAPIIDYYFNHVLIRRWLRLHYQRRFVNVPVRIYAATAEMVMSLVQQGAGIGMVPSYLIPAAQPKNFAVVRPTLKPLNDSIWLLEHSGPEPSAVHRAFKKNLVTRWTSSTRDKGPISPRRRPAPQI